MATVKERVIALVVDKLNVKDEASVQDDTSFTEDLNADSLDLVELIMAFEDKFSTPNNRLEIPDGEAADIKTIADVVNWLNNHGIKDQEEVPTR